MALSPAVLALLVATAPVETQTPPPPPVVEAPLPPAAAAPAAPVVQPAPNENDGAIVVTGRLPIKDDPLVAINETSFEAVQAVDDLIIAPVAHTYMDIVPQPLQQGLHNFLNNLDEPVVFVNFLLQLKPGKAVETLGRFVINSTIGIGGLMDVAKKKPFNLPRRSNGLADTLGYYGIGSGPYFFLPLIGSTTLRDGLGRIADLSLLPFAVGKPFTNPKVSLAKGALSSLDDRVEQDGEIKRVRTTGDPYKAMRDAYLARRKAEIDVLKGLRTSVSDPTPPVKKEHRKNATPQPIPAVAP